MSVFMNGNALRMRVCAACLVTACLCVLLSSCSSHIIHRHSKVSRDYSYLEFSRNSAPYVHKAQVGGEHSTFIKVLGFEDDVFTVKMKQTGDAGYTVYGEGVCIKRNALESWIQVVSESAMFTVNISARTYGEYTVKIEKYKHSSEY